MVQTPSVRAGFGRRSISIHTPDHHVALQFPGAKSSVGPRGIEPASGKANFLSGASGNHVDLPMYGKLLYEGLYEGIDLSFSASDGHLKSEFVIAPGTDPEQIRLQFPGSALSLTPEGALSVDGQEIQVIDSAPMVYQTNVHGQRIAIPGHYRLIAADTAGFETGSYDPSLPLIIDPVISYSTYLGGSGSGTITGVAVDSSGNQYVTGWTDAFNFPIASAYQAANRGSLDVFVAKFNTAGTALVYSTYIGGSGDDRAAAIAVDSSGQAYVAGSTASSNFPVASALRTYLSGARDAFALKLNSTGNGLRFSTYLGGSNWDVATAIAVDSLGSAFVAGDTQSTDLPVQTPAQSTIGGGQDAFVIRLNSQGILVYSTYLGGAGTEHVGGIAVDGSDNAYIAGGTTSVNFPTVTPLQAASGGGQDGFITKLSSTGSSILYSTYLGGNGGVSGSLEQINAIKVDSSGSAYVAGTTTSSNFPVTLGAFQTPYSAGQDAFAAKLSTAGNSLVYSTYLGGSGFDSAQGLAVDSAGSAHLAGYTSSYTFPNTSPVQSGFNGAYDAFVTKLSPAGNAVQFSTYYGGTGSDSATSIALDSSGNIYLGGQTASSNFPLTSAIQSNLTGTTSGWVARFGVAAPPANLPSVVSVSPTSGSGNTVTFTAIYSHPSGATALSTAAILVSGSASSAYACQVTYDRAANLFTLAADSGSGGTTAIPGGGDAQNSQCTLKGQSSSVILDGNNMTLTISLIFLPGFGGSKAVYLAASDSAASTGWVSKGTFTVSIPAPAPSVESVSPNAGSGATQTFAFVVSDTQSATNITGVATSFKSSLTFNNACYIAYDRNAGTVALLWDSGSGSNSRPLNSSTTLQNSQCSIGTTTSTLSGLSLIFTVTITFKPGFGGTQNIYMYAAEGSVNTGWIQKGTYTVTASGGPVATSVVPSSGVGPSQRFSFTVSDAGGAAYLTGAIMLFNSTFSQTNACNLAWDRNANKISLSYDNPANGSAPVVPGASTTVSNSQCILRGANTTVVVGTTSVVITVDLLFNAAFAGTKSVYLYAVESGSNSGWATVGTWTVSGALPTADSVSPSSGSGTVQTFALTMSDATTQANLTGLWALFTNGSPANITNACYLVYNRTNATVGLYDDTGTVLSTKGIGASGTLANSQCSVGYTVANTTATSLTFSINLVFFSPAFQGSKTVYMLATAPNTNSGWVARGTWTIP